VPFRCRAARLVHLSSASRAGGLRKACPWRAGGRQRISSKPGP